MNLAVNYEINTPWKKQIDPASVQAARTLAGSRMDLVDRNNNIVLEYRKRQVVTLNLPNNIRGKENKSYPLVIPPMLAMVWIVSSGMPLM